MSTGNATADYAGHDSARQSIGLPGHCDECARVGHVAAHPDLGCGDVGCTRGHGPEDGRIRAPHCNPGVMSGRSFTRKEIAAARRVGVVSGSTKKGTLGGPLFWATGQVWLDEARQNAADWALVAKALEREWDTWKDWH